MIAYMQPFHSQVSMTRLLKVDGQLAGVDELCKG